MVICFGWNSFQRCVILFEKEERERSSGEIFEPRNTRREWKTQSKDRQASGFMFVQNVFFLTMGQGGRQHFCSVGQDLEPGRLVDLFHFQKETGVILSTSIARLDFQMANNLHIKQKTIK